MNFKINTNIIAKTYNVSSKFLDGAFFMKIGLALSGGGVRGAAHIGILKSLQEAGIKIDYISGASAGSIVAALYASGYTPHEIEQIFLEFDSDSALYNKRKKLIDLDIKGILGLMFGLFFRREIKTTGLVKGEKIRKIMCDLCADKGISSFSQTKVPLAIPAVDINTADTIMFSTDCYSNEPTGIVNICDANVCEAVRASCAFPGIIKPHNYRGHRLADGGISDNVPSKVLRDMGADFVIAVNLGYHGDYKFVKNMFEISLQSVNIMGYQISRDKLSSADFILEPRLESIPLLGLNRIDDCIAIGYDSMQKSLKALKLALG